MHARRLTVPFMVVGMAIGVSTTIASDWQRTGLSSAFMPNQAGMTQDDQGRILAGSLAGVHRSLDGGQNWTLVNTEIDLTSPFSMQVNPQTNSIFTAVEVGVFRSVDGGVTWVPLDVELTGAYGIAVRHDWLIFTVGSGG
ncbi:MAG: hypothetical protein HY851_05230, partial [candidate division Zixibacteria bacterium]|nr:hypothetical protein [candidate division Zixibacteria bacterium]